MINPDALYELLFEAGLEPEYVEEDTQIAIPDPFCEDDKRRLYISSDTGAWICFHGSCGDAQGNLLRLLHTRLAYEGGDALDKLHELTGRRDEDPFAGTVSSHKWNEPVFQGLEMPPEVMDVDEETPPLFLKYLKRREVDLKLAKEKKIGYATTGRYAYRVVIPVMNGGMLYTFVARTVFKRCPSCLELVNDCTCEYTMSKVLTPTGGKPRLTLYNYDDVSASYSPRVVVMEGPFDVLRKPDEAVGILGSSISSGQIGLLSKLVRGTPRDLIVCLDGDDAGRVGARKVADALVSAMIKCYVVEMPEGKDPGSMPKEDLEALIRTAKRHML